MAVGFGGLGSSLDAFQWSGVGGSECGGTKTGDYSFRR